MDQSGTVKSTCFICLKTFCPPNKIEEESKLVIKHFWQLLTNYLEVNTDHNFTLPRKDNREPQVFCESCSVQVNRVNENYLELVSIELKLASKLEKLGEIMKQSELTVSSKLSHVLLNSLASQLGLEKSSHVKQLRMQIVSKCISKRKKCNPQAPIHHNCEKDDDEFENSTQLEDFEVKEEVESYSEDDEDEVHPPFDVDRDFLHVTTNQSSASDTWHSEAEADDRVGEEEIESPGGEGEDMDVSSQSCSSRANDSDSDFSSSSHSSGDTKPMSRAKRKKNQRRREVIKRRNPRRRSKVAEYNCEICGNPFNTLPDLSIHARLFHSDLKKSIKCCFCFRSFALHQVYQLHLQNRHKTIDISFPCEDPQCSQVFSSPDLLKKHLKTAHPSQEIYNCQQCSWTFLDPYRLTLHELVHTPRIKNVFTCSLCPCYFGRLDEFQDHYNVKHGSKQKIRKCPKCPVRCATTFSINRHMKSHLEGEDPERPLSCSDCGKKCKDVSTLKFHRTWYHTEIPCPNADCGMKFRRQLHLVRHIKLVHNLGSEASGSSSGVLLPCKVCGKPVEITETDDSLMKTHLETHLSAEERQRLICDLCGLSFSSEIGLLDHIYKFHEAKRQRKVKRTGKLKKVHGDNHQQKEKRKGTGKVNKTFICEICAKVCHYQKSLNDHMNTVHLNPTPKICKCNFQSCNKSFQTQEQLKSHVQQEHEGEFMCNLCGRVFTNLQRLQRHGVFHTGEKAHTCPVCNKGFSQSWTLKEHLKSMHPEGNSESMEEHECQQPGCDAKFKVKSYLMRHMRRKHKIFMRTGN